jgi:hypothetical protein
MVNYPATAGEMRGQDLDDYPRTGDRFYAEAIRELARQGINPTKVLMDAAHDMGMKVHVAIRPGAWVHSEPCGDFFNSKFYQTHPEWRCVDRDGATVARMSFAVPQVRTHLVDVLREAVRFGADGASILYVRGVPFVLFEKPFRDLFQKRFGADALEVDEADSRIQQLRVQVMTEFMREVRTMLDQEATGRGGKRLELSAMVLANEADNLKHGLDVRRWANEGLLDLVCPYLGAGGGSAREYDLKFFEAVCRPRNVPVKPTFIAWRTPDLDALVKKAVEYYQQAADGLTVWDANSGADRTDMWSVVSRLGHADELLELSQEGTPKPIVLRFHRLGDLIMDGRFSPNWGY